jgi:hypothetical protein
MSDNCNTNVCQRQTTGDGTIPAELTDKWNIYITENCDSLDCPRRYTTRCCVWGKFKEQQ